VEGKLVDVSWRVFGFYSMDRIRLYFISIVCRGVYRVYMINRMNSIVLNETKRMFYDFYICCITSLLEA